MNESELVLDNFQLGLKVNFGEFSLTAKQVLELSAGDILEFNLGGYQNLSILFGEEEIAKAKLIKNKGAMALQIVSVNEFES